MSETKNKILIVEDDKFLSEMYVSKLKEAGFEIEAAYDGLECLKMIKEFQPDLILLDIVLPRTDGFEILQKIKKDPVWQKVKVVALTNLGQKDEVEKGLRLGADDYVIKAHFTPTEVVAKIKKLLNL